MTDRPAAPCDICSQPTASQIGVCARSDECLQEGARRRRRAKALAKAPRPLCEVCGHPVRSKYGVCYDRTPECAREWKRRERLAHLDARKEHERRWYLDNRERHAATGRAWREANIEAAREYHRTYNQTWNAENRDAVAEARRRYQESSHGKAARRAYLQRTDRLCKNAASGCPEFAVPGSKFCREHTNADAMRRWERKRQRVQLKLAAAQGGECTWCENPLPGDLSETHVDHIIPTARGGPDLEWNWALLHAMCNLRKNDKITPRAIELAAEHGIALDADEPAA